MKAEKADPIDREVGAEVRLRRIELGLSQATLGRACGVTFQQLQKYERGENRISASVLHRIASALGCPVGELFPSAEVALAPSRAAALVPEMLLIPQLSAEAREAVALIIRSLARPVV